MANGDDPGGDPPGAGRNVCGGANIGGGGARAELGGGVCAWNDEVAGPEAELPGRAGGGVDPNDNGGGAENESPGGGVVEPKDGAGGADNDRPGGGVEDPNDGAGGA